MEVVYVTHPAFASHDTGTWHPERPARLAAAERGVWASGLDVRPFEAARVDRDLLESVHRPSYVAAIERFCAAGGGALDADTVAVGASWEAALRAAGAGPQAVALLERSDGATAFLNVRPPGHHALPDRAMGFCLFNNVVVTSALLRSRGKRVAILDWDVHHGNGTQAMVWNDPDVLYISLHQHPFYPLTGLIDERGGTGAKGTVINFPLPPGTAGDVYRQIMERVVVPVLSGFGPDWLLVSCGFDAHRDDPLADLKLLSSDYGSMASALTTVVPASRIVTFLEGGYDLAAISSATADTLRGLAGTPTDEEPPGALVSPPEAFEVVDRVARWLG